MAVPLGQIKNRLVVAMLDADNIQAVDFLSKRIGRPLKVYTASEEGIRQVLNQYGEDVEADVTRAIGRAITDEEHQAILDEETKKNKNI